VNSQLWENIRTGPSLYDADGNFQAAIELGLAQRLVDFGKVDRISKDGDRPLRIKARCKRQWKPKRNAPTSGCTTAASLTARESEANAEGALMQRKNSLRSLMWMKSHPQVHYAAEDAEFWCKLSESWRAMNLGSRMVRIDNGDWVLVDL
jgi:hypothetical protein